MNRDPWFRNRLIRDGIYRAIEERMMADSSVYLMGEGAWAKVHYDAINIERYFSDRVITLPISEDSNTNFAVGLSLAGIKPIVDVITGDFLFRTMDAICNTVAKTAFCDRPRTIVIRAEFLIGGPTTGQRLESLFARIPGLSVVVPSNPLDAYGLMLAALQRPGATMFFEDRMIEDSTTPNAYSVMNLSEEDLRLAFRIGSVSAEWFGHKGTVVSYGIGVRRIMNMFPDGAEFDFIDLRTLYPLDLTCVLASTERTGRLLFVEPAVRFGGIGAEVVAQVVDRQPGTVCRRIGGPRKTAPACRDLHDSLLPTEDDIRRAIEEMMP